jgi:hypothetical protein
MTAPIAPERSDQFLRIVYRYESHIELMRLF